MPSTSGHGASLGAAFISALKPLSLGAGRPSYHAKGTRAQFRQLERTSAGRAALEGAGVGGNKRTRAAWLAGTRQPSKANQAAIQAAYDAMRSGGLPAWVKLGEMKITGKVKIGNDSRDRGTGGNEPFRVKLGNANWSRIEGELAKKEPDPDVIEDEIIDDIIDSDDDIANDSEPWEFPGSSYEVEITG